MNRDELFRYFKLYNQGHFEDAVDSYYVEDAYFWNIEKEKSVHQKNTGCFINVIRNCLWQKIRRAGKCLKVSRNSMDKII